MLKKETAMKKRVSLNVFAILMTALLLFSGSAWAVPAPVTASIGDIAAGFTVSAPVPVTDVTAVTHAIAGGDGHSLAIRRDGTLWAWGFNRHGQLGDGTTTDRLTPVQVLTDVGFVPPVLPVIVPVTGVTVTPTSATINVGATQQLTATVAPANATNRAVTWTSNNPAIARVDANGLVTAVAAGTATITARTADGGFTGTSSITVAVPPPPVPPATMEVNSGRMITIAPGGTLTTIPLDIKRIPDLGPGNGVGAFTFDLSWNPAIIHLDNVTGKSIAGFVIMPGTPDNIRGTVRITGFTGGAFLTGDVTVATLNLSAKGAAGTSTSIDVTIIDLGDRDGKTIPATPVSAPVRIIAIAGVAETAISQDVADDRIVVIPVKVVRIKDPVTGEPVNIPGGLGAFEATVTSSPAGGIEILGARGTDYFPRVTFNPATGEFSAVHAPSPAQPDNTVVAKIVARLTGNAVDRYTLTVTFQVIGAAGGGLNVPQKQPNSLIFLRGDATGDGTVNIFDAMFIANKVAGIGGLDTVNALNAASVKHDGLGDVINIFDAMYIAQYVVRLRDAHFNWVE
jgi:hypothetical protein